MSASKTDDFTPALNTDVLIIILRHLVYLRTEPRVPHEYPYEWASCLSLRLLSKQLNELVVPIGHRTIVLGARILFCFKTYLQVQHQQPVGSSSSQSIDDQLKVVEHIRTYTHHIHFSDQIPSSDWSLVPDTLYSMKNLKQLTWTSFNYDDKTFLSEVLACPRLRARWPKLRIPFDGFYDFEAIQFYSQLVDVVSCTDRHDDPRYADPKATDIIQLKKLLLASPNMEVFDMASSHGEDVNADWNIRDWEKLPAFKDLELFNIRWNFSQVEAVTFWDWSRITRLRMKGVNIIHFLRTVPPECLSGLHTFETDCWGSDKGVEEASRLLCNLVNTITALESLQMQCNMRSHINRCFPAIIDYGRSLRSLRLRDFRRPNGNPNIYSVLSIKKLEALGSACPILRELAIDVKLTLDACQKMRSVLAITLASFRNLRKLDLHTFMSFPRPGTDFDSWEIDIITPMFPWMKDLVSMKQGLEFDTVSLLVETNRTTNDPGWHECFPIYKAIPVNKRDESSTWAIVRVRLSSWDASADNAS